MRPPMGARTVCVVQVDPSARKLGLRARDVRLGLAQGCNGDVVLGGAGGLLLQKGLGALRLAQGLGTGGLRARHGRRSDIDFGLVDGRVDPEEDVPLS